MAFTLKDFQDALRSRGLDRVAHLAGKYPDVVEPFLPRIHERLVAKGIVPAPGAAAPAPAGLTPAEETVLPYLRELDAALSSGGEDAVLTTFTKQLEDPEARAAYLAVAAA